MPGLLEGIVAGSSASGTGNLGDIIATLTEMYGAAALAVAVTLPRIGAAFIMLPLLSRETAPALVRNSLYVCLAVVVFPLSAQNYDVNMVSGALWPLILVKEIFLGVVIGLLFGSIFWALGVAGGMLDTQTGSNMASLVDPIQGHQSSLTSQWLSRLAAVLFMVSGAFLIFLEVLLTSYLLWPVDQLLPELNVKGVDFFAGQFGFIMTRALLIASPAILVLATVDIAFGLINRFAQQINVLPLSMPIKSWLATWIMMLMAGMIAEMVVRHLAESLRISEQLSRLFR
ncbi:MAG: EscT/YscT/HrcT family type III secretion system export apparatus protein [Proteobacteria bacterium]|nr:MAG: EscT/YscT/HrcT family type III secretion system export apparatus protein [Pseudomonadota bacterium]